VKRHLGFGGLSHHPGLSGLYSLSGIIGGAAVVVLAAQPAHASATQITNIQLNAASGGVQVILETNNGDRPQVFTVNRGNALIADIINTELKLPAGNGFLQNNPAPGISSVSVTQLDSNSVRVQVSGDGESPAGQVSQDGGLITLNVSGAATSSRPQANSFRTAEAQPTIPGAQNPAQTPRVAQVPSLPSGWNQSAGNVMVPNPTITYDGGSGQVAQAAPPGVSTGVPRTQPRAIAPPLGDMSVSNIDSSASEVNLGSTEVVPRLVLRDAPVRDVLSLLARAAGMNVAYVGDSEGGQAAAPTGGTTGSSATDGVRVSLDIENEPVQDVFNYVLRVANLEANRSGRTIFVSPRLPDTARNIITRTIRVNQTTSLNAASYLATLGAETQQLVPGGEQTETIRDPDTGLVRTTTRQIPASISTITVAEGTSPRLLRGLAVTADPRLNSVTLVGDPRQIAIAASMLGQIDLRQRQVAVNVKVVDINLLATDNFRTSFSFGAGNGFFTVDGGAAFLNYGRLNPPSADQASGSLNSPPTIPNPYSGNEPFLDPNQTLNIPNGGGGVVDQGRFTPTDANFLLPSSPLGRNDNPLRPGVTDFTPGTPTAITRDAAGNVTFTQGTASTITSALPSLFQYPSRFLASLQTQVVSGNAKILTDPTLVIQEGQQAEVELGQEVITNVTITRVDTDGGTRTETTFEKGNAGLNLGVTVDRIDDNGFVSLNITPEVTSPSGSQQIGNQTVTLLNQRRLSTGRLRLRDGQTLIVSGIIQDSDRTTISKVPILGDIPILGALFRSTQRDNTRQEVIILLTPQVLNDDENSDFGYRYNPMPETQELLQRQGVQVP
jgi:type IV pilus assembly protein PilQ